LKYEKTPSPERLRGLSADEAARRLIADGPNSLPDEASKSHVQIVINVLREPMFMMLLAAGTVYLLLGDKAEAIFLLGAVFVVIGLTITQERKTQRALEALRDLSAPRALVIRDGVRLRVPSCEVVVGDILVLREGDRIVADSSLLQGNLDVDESSLTGEAVPNNKQLDESEMPLGVPGGDNVSSVFASTVVTKGSGIACVRAIGAQTVVGQIGSSLASTTVVPSNLQRESRIVVRRLASVGFALAAAMVLLSWLWDGKGLLDSLLLGIALTMAILPEEIPVILTIFLALGAWRLSRQNVLTRQITAVEALGAITVLAVDKTGTLTQNRMTVAELRAHGSTFQHATNTSLPEHFHELAEFATLAAPLDPFDPMEKAIRSFTQHYLLGTEHIHADWVPERTYALSADILAMTLVFPVDAPTTHLLAAKGSPEAIVDLCHLSAADRARVALDVHEMAACGLRVLGVAKGNWIGVQAPMSQHDFDFTFLGLLGLIDPPRADVPAAIAACHAAGIRIIMMTGDHPATARAIADQVGLSHSSETLLGSELLSLDDESLRTRLKSTEICARLQPEHKLRLVRLLQQSGETVAMTGDGVNDAPALKAADVGIAMGERGTDVAREAAAIVLLNDSFSNITAAIKQGRRIYDNIYKATRFVFAVHVPIVALALGPVLFHWPILLLPVHIVLLELLIDPACSIVFEAEAESADVMSRMPRTKSESPFSVRNAVHGISQGLGLALVLLCGAWVLTGLQWEERTIRTTTFIVIVVGVLLLIVTNRTASSLISVSLKINNVWLLRLFLGLMIALVLVFSVPWTRELMGFELPTVHVYAATAIMLIAVAMWMGLVALFVRLYTIYCEVRVDNVNATTVLP
jgi:P-type Ca2+ transporter type 2C